jgi:hypothetical protein
VGLCVIVLFLVVATMLIGECFRGGASLDAVIVSVFGFGPALFFGWFGLRSLRVLIWINVVVSMLLIITTGVFAYEKSYTQLIFMLMMWYALGLAIINFVGAFVHSRKHDLKGLIPLGITLVTWFGMGYAARAGFRVSLYVFEKRLPRFEEAVASIGGRIEEGILRLSGQEIPEEYRDLAYMIIAEKTRGNVLTVTFMWGAGFPVKHVAYAYISDGMIPAKGTDFRREWPRIYRINDNWFRVSD